MNGFKNIARVTSMYMAAVIGAGFASGQEIMQFFSSYYKGGFYGIILAGFLFSAIGCIVLDKVYTGRIRNYDEFLYPAAGRIPGLIIQTAVTLFSLIIFFVMSAGLVGILSGKAGIPFLYSAAIVTIVCLVAVINGIKGISVLNLFTVPVLAAGILAVGFYIIVTGNTAVFNTTGIFGKLTGNWVISSISYVSYNSLMAVVVLCSLLPYLKKRSTGIAGGILGGFGLCLIALVLNLAIYMFYPNSTPKEFPLLGIIEKFSNWAGIAYSVVLWLAMLISAVTSGYCFIDRVHSLAKINTKLLAIAICLFAVPVSVIGFSKLISALYPVFGYIGMFTVFLILIQGVRDLFAGSSS